MEKIFVIWKFLRSNGKKGFHVSMFHVSGRKFKFSNYKTQNQISQFILQFVFQVSPLGEMSKGQRGLKLNLMNCERSKVPGPTIIHPTFDIKNSTSEIKTLTSIYPLILPVESR